MTGEGLAVRGLRAGYGRMTIVLGVDLDVEPGEVVALLGRNGAGKSTTLNVLAGLRTAWSDGTVEFGGRDLAGAGAAEIAGAGIGYVPEGRRIFKEMSVRENLLLGAYLRRRQPRRELSLDLDRMVLLFPPLGPSLDTPAGRLSGGQQQMLAVAQAMMGRPQILLLDEPTSGISPSLSEELYDAVGALASEGLGVLVVEQNPERAIRHTDRVLVMDSGRIELSGHSTDDGILIRVNDSVLGIPTLP